MAMNGEEIWGLLSSCISLLITSVNLVEVVNLCILGNLITEIKIFVFINIYVTFVRSWEQIKKIKRDILLRGHISVS
jgi:hypothetical protein